MNIILEVVRHSASRTFLAAICVAMGVLPAVTAPVHAWQETEIPSLAEGALSLPRSNAVRVAGIVLKWLRGDKAANCRRIEPLIREAARQGAHVVCTTECFLDGYAIADKSIPLEQYRALGERIPEGEYFRKLASLAGELKIFLIAGMLEADGDQRFNTAVLIGPNGALVGKYHKQQLEHEAVRNTPGHQSSLFETPMGKIGVMICADRRSPEVVKAFCERGADFLICPSGGMFGPSSNDPILQARSKENGQYIVFVHPAEFLVTGPNGAILDRSLLGNRLLISPGEIGTAADSQRVCFFDVPHTPSRAQKKAAGDLPGLPKPADLSSQTSLPDPLLMLDGRKVTTREMWVKERRPELIRLFQHYMYGQLPPKPTLSPKVERVDAAAFGGKATLSEVTLTFGPPGMSPIHLMLIVPNQRVRPVPVVLALNYFGNHTLVRDPQVRLPDNWMPQWGGEGAWSAKVVGNRATDAGRGSWAKFWPIEDLIHRGYALATFYNGDVDPDTPDQRGLQKGFRQPDAADDCGTIAAWAWGLQRAVDVLVTAPGIDARRIVVTGHSRTGKAALVAAAFDERIALAIPHQAGCGGSAPSRAGIAIGTRYNTLDKPQTKPPETVFNLNDKFPHWFNARFKEFNNQAARLPFDQNCLVALCAPRPVLFTNGRADTWINPAGQFEVLRAAAPVYRLLGAGDFAAEDLPPDGQVIGDVLGYYLRPGAHSLLREDWKVFLDFADKRLGRP